jgi:hypothetical protein
MRRTVEEGLTASKVAQQWPRLRSVTCYILESHDLSKVDGTNCAAASGVEASKSAAGALPMHKPSGEASLHPQRAVPSPGSVPGWQVLEAGEDMLYELMQAQPSSFESGWPASNGAIASVLTAYTKSLFVLTRAAAEAVMDLESSAAGSAVGGVAE